MSARWTFMVYIAGDDSLAGREEAEMRTVGSGEELKVAAFVGAHRMLLGKDAKDDRHDDLGPDVGSGTPQTLLDFVRWAHEQAPADRYALVVCHHGSHDFAGLCADVKDAGVTARELSVHAHSQLARSLFQPTIETVLKLPTAGERAIASDDGTGHSLDTLELGSVLEHAHQLLDQPLDLLGMDACLMSCLEVSYQAAGHVRAVVSSEAIEPGDGWPYGAILGELRSNPGSDGAALGRIVVRRYTESFKTRRDQWPVTMCAIHSAGLEPFADALDAFTRALRRAISDDETDATRLLRAHSRSLRFEGDLVDLKSLCEHVRAQPFGAPVKDAARRVLEALKPGGEFVVANAHLGEEVERCGGVTAYLPAPTDEISRYFKDLRFAERHGWDEFLRSYRRAVRG